tara:strand:+ start:779 stop:970 length:192 start_codon:yes stop_codon:yes gene_type:complete
MKYKLISGLKLQYGHTQTPNRVCRNLLKGEAVELKKENLDEFESLGVKVRPIEKKKPKNKEEK